MNTNDAIAKSLAAKNNPMRVFDWDKAATILADRQPDKAAAGLSADMEWTSGTIWLDGKPVTDCYTFLSSNWATPVLVIDDDEIECWTMEDGSSFHSDTKWPESALKIINGAKQP